jgi:hypothetical protein
MLSNRLEEASARRGEFQQRLHMIDDTCSTFDDLCHGHNPYVCIEQLTWSTSLCFYMEQCM